MRDEEAADRALEKAKKQIEEYVLRARKTLKPLPLQPIPDNPPPHEGALIDIPYVLERPDILKVEVRDALPGMPISGSRIVTPDGTIRLGFYGTVHVRGLTLEQTKLKIVLHLRTFITDEALGLIGINDDGWPLASPWQETTHVFVEVDTYNSQRYHVLGDVARPGRYPTTGNETVLDAIEYAGGLLPTAELKDMRLVRPPRGDQPAKTYSLDWDAISTKGDSRANLQLFNGDRLYVGRNPIAHATLERNQLARPFSLVLHQIMDDNEMLKGLPHTGVPEGPALTASQREEIRRGSVDSWLKTAPASVPPEVVKTIREMVVRPHSLPAQKLAGPN